MVIKILITIICNVCKLGCAHAFHRFETGQYLINLMYLLIYIFQIGGHQKIGDCKVCGCHIRGEHSYNQSPFYQKDVASQILRSKMPLRCRKSLESLQSWKFCGSIRIEVKTIWCQTQVLNLDQVDDWGGNEVNVLLFKTFFENAVLLLVIRSRNVLWTLVFNALKVILI